MLFGWWLVADWFTFYQNLGELVASSDLTVASKGSEGNGVRINATYSNMQAIGIWAQKNIADFGGFIDSQVPLVATAPSCHCP